MRSLEIFKDSLQQFCDAVLKRRLLSGVLIYLLALVLIRNQLWGLCILIILLLLITFVYSVKIRNTPFIAETLIYMIVFFAAGIFVMSLAESKGTEINDSDKVKLKGIVTDREELEYSDRYTLKIGMPYYLCYVYSESGMYNIQIGDVLIVEGDAELFEKVRNDGGFDAESYYLSRNIRFSVDAESVRIAERPKYSFRESLRIYREILSGRIDRFTAKNNGLLKAILLGDKSDVETYEKELYQRCGISHILALSGLHVSNLSILISFFLKRLRIHRNIVGFISFIILFIYSVFSGFSSSVVRAVIMFGVSNAALLMSKDYDVPTAMSLSFFIYTLIYPYAYSAPGTVLSYSAIFSIWIFSVNYKKMHKLKYPERIHNFLQNKVLKTLYMSLFITYFSLPLVLEYFYTTSLFSIPINLYVVPAMTVLFMISVAALIFSFVNGLVAKILFSLCSLIISSFTHIADMSVNKFNGVLVCGKPLEIEIVIYYFVILLILLMLHKVKHKHLLWSVLLIPLLLIITRSEQNTLTMVDVDQGDCSIVTTDSGGVFMIDCGSTGENEIYKYTVEPYLLANGISKIDYVFLSHSDMDHVNGIIEYLKVKISPVKILNIVITPQMYKDERIWDEIINPAMEKDINIKIMKAGDELMYKGAYISCIHPTNDSVSNDVNDDSMVLSFKIEDVNTLFTGDISSLIEEQLPVSDTDILKVTHHGSKTGTGEEFLKILNPEIAMISCGMENSYGHPSKIVLDNLRKYKVKTLITAETGQIRIYINDSDYRLITMHN